MDYSFITFLVVARISGGGERVRDGYARFMVGDSLLFLKFVSEEWWVSGVLVVCIEVSVSLFS